MSRKNQKEANLPIFRWPLFCWRECIANCAPDSDKTDQHKELEKSKKPVNFYLFTYICIWMNVSYFRNSSKTELTRCYNSPALSRWNFGNLDHDFIQQIPGLDEAPACSPSSIKPGIKRAFPSYSDSYDNYTVRFIITLCSPTNSLTVHQGFCCIFRSQKVSTKTLFYVLTPTLLFLKNDVIHK